MNLSKELKKHNKFILIISIFMLTMLASILNPKEVKAMVKWNGSTTSGMPTFSIVNKTGLFPQIVNQQRIITMPENRYNLNTQSWVANITPGTIYCQDQGLILRNGKIDRKTYYSQEYGVDYDSHVDIMKTSVKSSLSSEVPDDAFDIHYDFSDNCSGNVVKSERMFTDLSYNYVKTVSTKIISEIMYYLTGEKKPTEYSSDIDSVKTYKEWDGDPVYGPQVCVMETQDGAENGYQLSKRGTYKSSNKGTDAKAAYILTALENMYGAKTTNQYTEEDIQTAYWMLVDNSYKDSKLTIKGKELYNKAQEYGEFLNEEKTVTIDNSKTKVIANRDSQEYIVGPFKMYYPDYIDISYIKSMYITTNTGKQLVIDENNNDFELILSSGGTTGSNGITKTYPKSGESFFIKFSAKDTGYPDNIELHVNLEYINNISINYNELRTKANIYRYYGYSQQGGEYPMNAATITVTGTVVYYTREVYGHSSGCHYHRETGWECSSSCKAGEEYNQRHEEVETQTKEVVQPYVKMGPQPESTDKAQPLVVALDGSRGYTKIKKSVKIDLTMEMGGNVWEDSEGGKESISNGKIDSTERKIPNVIVTLYRSNGTIIATTKTNSNGVYKFSKLNPMYQYYIKFTYNGQYYQPTTYSSSSTWRTNGWSANSNGTDKKNERLAYNIKFEKIASSPINYNGLAGYNETYTKQELLGYTLQSDGTYKKTRQAVIDEFGNLILESSNDVTTQKMIQYVKDCRIDAYTGNGNGGHDLYPVPSKFVIDEKEPLYRELLGWKIEKLYNNAYNINLGLNPRQQSDLAIKKDVEKVTLEINGQEHIYTYNTLENKENAEKTWDINLRLSDAVSSKKYYDTNYSRELYASDYLYKVSSYGTNFADYGKAKSDELEVYLTYKIMVRNQAMSIQARVDELVDYYDKDLEYIDTRSYIEIKRGTNAGKYATQANAASRYESISKNTVTTIDGYDKLYIRGLSEGAQPIDEKGNAVGEPITAGMYLEAGQTAYVYLTFRVKKDSRDGEDWVRLDEELETAKAIGVGKENLAELNGYTTRYAKGTKVPNVGDVSYNPAGIVDRDSNPGNLNPSDVPKDGKINYQNFEDDTDKAPNIRIILNRDDNAVRVISGSVWEDERTESIGLTTTGDGIRDNKDKTLINGVTVQLVELMENGTEFIWRTFENGSGTAASTTPIINKYNLVKDYTFEKDHNGQYAFKSFMPGKYIIRFIYGDTIKTVTPASLNMGGLNEKSYNGQDFKSTTYQEGITQNKVYTWRDNSTWKNGQETLGNILTEVSTFKADASNNETANAKLNAQSQKGYLYDITASDAKNNVSDAKDIESRRNEVINYSDNDVTNYIAEVLASHKADYSTMNDRNQLLNDLMANTKMTAETGLMVIEFEYAAPGTDGNKKDNTYKIQNVDLGLEERPKAQLAIDKEVTNVKLTLADGSILFDAKNTASNVLWRDHKAYNVGYTGNVMDKTKFGNIENIRNKNSSKFGLIQLSMDEELMHGATMEITYQVKVSNIGEVDYKDNLFYYTGNKSTNAQVVTTRADQVIDYVANNLQFNASNNSNWKVIEKDEIKSQGLVNSKLDKQVEKYNTVIQTKDLNKDLVPSLYKDKEDKNAVDTTNPVPLVLTQLITSENDSDDLTYRNLVEIVKTSNTVGRRMEYSVVGNQDPEKAPQELDSDISEVVKILPPFGNAGIYITIAIVTLAAIAIVIGGTIFIKKKVLRK